MNDIYGIEPADLAYVEPKLFKFAVINLPLRSWPELDAFIEAAKHEIIPGMDMQKIQNLANCILSIKQYYTMYNYINDPTTIFAVNHYAKITKLIDEMARIDDSLGTNNELLSSVGIRAITQDRYFNMKGFIDSYKYAEERFQGFGDFAFTSFNVHKPELEALIASSEKKARIPLPKLSKLAHVKFNDALFNYFMKNMKAIKRGLNRAYAAYKICIAYIFNFENQEALVEF